MTDNKNDLKKSSLLPSTSATTGEKSVRAKVEHLHADSSFAAAVRHAEKTALFRRAIMATRERAQTTGGSTATHVAALPQNVQDFLSAFEKKMEKKSVMTGEKRNPPIALNLREDKAELVLPIVWKDELSCLMLLGLGDFAVKKVGISMSFSGVPSEEQLKKGQFKLANAEGTNEFWAAFWRELEGSEEISKIADDSGSVNSLTSNAGKGAARAALLQSMDDWNPIALNEVHRHIPDQFWKKYVDPKTKNVTWPILRTVIGQTSAHAIEAQIFDIIQELIFIRLVTDNDYLEKTKKRIKLKRFCFSQSDLKKAVMRTKVIKTKERVAKPGSRGKTVEVSSVTTATIEPLEAGDIAGIKAIEISAVKEVYYDPRGYGDFTSRLDSLNSEIGWEDKSKYLTEYRQLCKEYSEFVSLRYKRGTLVQGLVAPRKYVTKETDFAKKNKAIREFQKEHTEIADNLIAPDEHYSWDTINVLPLEIRVFSSDLETSTYKRREYIGNPGSLAGYPHLQVLCKRYLDEYKHLPQNRKDQWIARFGDMLWEFPST